MNLHSAEAERKPVPKVWIDLDTGADDAAAIMAACALENRGLLQIMGMSAVSGNVPLEHTFRNTRDVLHLCGKDRIPVYPGASRPLIEEPVHAAYVHGERGIGEALPVPSPAKEETQKAWDALYRCACDCGGELELILTGPQTNAAIAFAKYPDLKTRIRRILVMGGADIGGNITAAAEFNIYADPHAAQAVLNTGLLLVMCGLDVTMDAGLDPEHVRLLEESGTKAGRFFEACMRPVKKMTEEHGAKILALHDVCPVLYAVYPDLFGGERCGVMVETRGKLTRGQTVTDRDTDNKFPVRNVMLVRSVDRDRFQEILTGLLEEI